MNIGVRAHDISAQNISELFSKINKMGFGSVQLALKKSVKEFELTSGSFSPGLAKYFKDALIKNNICVSVLGSYINPINPDDEARESALSFFEENLKYARFLGADMVGTETGCLDTPDKTHGEENYQVFLSSMKRLVKTAEKLGVFIAVEAVSSNTINNPKKMKRFLDDIDSPNVLVILDTVNMLNLDNYKEHEKVIDEAFELYKDKIAAVHLKDFKYEDGRLLRTIPGEGEFNFDYLFKTLKKHKPHISMLMEENKEEDILRGKENLEKLFEEA